MTDLFRPEAIENSSRRYGSVLKLGATNYWFWVSVLLFVVVGAVFGIGFYQYARWEPADGITAYKTPPTTIASPYPAVVTKILIRNGQSVSKGQALLHIQAPSASDTSIDPVSRQRDSMGLVLEYRAQADALERDRLDSALKSMAAQKQGLIAQIRSTEQDIKNQSADIERIEQFLEKLKKNEYRDALPRAQLMDYESRLTNSISTESAARQRLDQLRLEIAKLEDAGSDSKNKLALALQASNSFRAAQEIERLSNVMEKGGIVYSPISGVVSNLNVLPGSMAPASYAMMTIVPAAPKIVGVMMVSGDQATFIRVGSEVRLRFKSYNFRTHGEVRSRVGTVSASPYFEDLAQTFGVSKEQARYRVEVVISDESFKHLSDSPVLLAGMKFEGIIVKSRGPLFEKIFERRVPLAAEQAP